MNYGLLTDRRAVVQAVTNSLLTTIPQAKRPTKKIFHGNVPELAAAAVKNACLDFFFFHLLVIIIGKDDLKVRVHVIRLSAL